jgi:hypothetical protein
MQQRDLILELLDEISPKAYCDDCISSELGIQTRQQVNQICRSLERARLVRREKSPCGKCGKSKTTNARAPAVKDAPFRGSQTLEPGVSTRGGDLSDFDIEKTRNELVAICRALWQTTQTEPRPHSVSVVINTLRQKGVLPHHQANMMLTLCNLRNVHVYEGLPLGDSEFAIAANAYKIVSEWWRKQKSLQATKRGAIRDA